MCWHIIITKYLTQLICNRLDLTKLEEYKRSVKNDRINHIRKIIVINKTQDIPIEIYEYLKRYKEHNTAHYENPESLFARHQKQDPNHKIEFQDSIQLLKNINNRTTA